jgi:transglutaminase/protease-like cytokinesis protein 3
MIDSKISEPHYVVMIKKIVLLLLISCSTLTYAQSNYLILDNASKKVPYSLKSSNAIALELTKKLNTDIEKTRAIYIWITHNISYDYALLENLPKYTSSKDLVEYVLKKRTGVCQHYADLFLDMTQSIGLETFLIAGYTRDYKDSIATISHAWNAIKIDSKYYFIDTTWSAGYIKEGRFVRSFNDKYFLIRPEDFIKTHIAFDPIYQFLPSPIRHIDFQEKNFDKLDLDKKYLFEDILNKTSSLDTITKLKKSISRIIKCGVTNDMTKKVIDNNLNKITSIEFRAVIDTLNYGIDNYNKYIESKNNKFKNPKLSDADIKELIDSASTGFYASNQLILGLSSTNRELSKAINFEKNRLPTLIDSVDLEKEFVTKYLKKWKPLRGIMFYNYKPNTVHKSKRIPLF